MARDREKKKAANKRHRENNRAAYNAYQKKWRGNNPQAYADISLRSRFGITLEQYEDLLRAQDSVCPICLCKPVSPVVDHDHKTLEVRGILCRTCNIGIGMLKDDPELIKRALTYLKA